MSNPFEGALPPKPFPPEAYLPHPTIPTRSPGYKFFSGPPGPTIHVNCMPPTMPSGQELPPATSFGPPPQQQTSLFSPRAIDNPRISGIVGSGATAKTYRFPNGHLLTNDNFKRNPRYFHQYGISDHSATPFASTADPSLIPQYQLPAPPKNPDIVSYSEALVQNESMDSYYNRVGPFGAQNAVFTCCQCGQTKGCKKENGVCGSCSHVPCGGCVFRYQWSVRERIVRSGPSGFYVAEN